MRLQPYLGNPASPIPPAPLGWALCTHADDYARKHAATLGRMPLWSYGDVHIPDAGPYRFFRWENALGHHTISALRYEGAAAYGGTLGAAGTGGYAADYTLTDDAIVPIDPKVGAAACKGGWSTNASDGTANAQANEIYKLGVGQERMFFVNNKLWKQTNMAGGGSLYVCSDVDTGALGVTPSLFNPASWTTAEKWTAGAVAAVLVGGVLYWVFAR